MKWTPKNPGKALPPHYAVPKSDGDAAVQAWIDLLPDWQTALARQIDAIVTGEIAGVHKAVRWHGAWYGVPGLGWMLALNTFKAHLKLTFFDGRSLNPVPPDPLAMATASALNLRQTGTLDTAQITDWVRQARLLPGYGKA